MSPAGRERPGCSSSSNNIRATAGLSSLPSATLGLAFQRAQGSSLRACVFCFGCFNFCGVSSTSSGVMSYASIACHSGGVLPLDGPRATVDFGRGASCSTQACERRSAVILSASGNMWKPSNSCIDSSAHMRMTSWIALPFARHEGSKRLVILRFIAR